MPSLIARTVIAASVCLSCCPVSGDAADGVSPSSDMPWGKIVQRQMALELHVLEVPDDRVIGFPRLNNRMKSLYVEGKKSAESELKFRPQIETWEVILPESFPSDGSRVIVFETHEPIQIAVGTYVVPQAQDGSVTLPAHHAVTHGKLLRFEPQPHKNTVGYWADADDWAEWHFNLQRPGKFAIEVLQGCGKGQGGSIVEIDVGGNRFDFAVEDTGHFQNFKSLNVGVLTVAESGVYKLKVRAIRKAKAAVCDIRQIRLTPSAD